MINYFTRILIIGLIFWSCEDNKNIYETEKYMLYNNLILGEDTLYYHSYNDNINIYSGIVHQQLGVSNKYMGEIVNGKKEGRWNYWRKNGDISFSHRYRNGEIYSIACYY